MPSFRAHPISKNHKVAATPSAIIICESERDGLQQAQPLVNEDDLELWDGPRFIARLKPRQEKGLKIGKTNFFTGRLGGRTLCTSLTLRAGVGAIVGPFAAGIMAIAMPVTMNTQR